MSFSKTFSSTESIVFIRFLSLIITEHIRKVLRDTHIDAEQKNPKTWISRYTVPEVFKNTYKPIHPEKTKAQRQIFEIFELES